MLWKKRLEAYGKGYRLCAKYKKHNLSVVYNSFYDYYFFLVDYDDGVSNSLWEGKTYTTEEECKEACIAYVDKEYRKPSGRVKVVRDFAREKEQTDGDVIFICKNIFTEGTREEKLDAIKKVFHPEVASAITKNEAWDIIRYLLKEISDANN